MSYKKIIILPAFFLLSNFLYISCCKCIDSNQHYYNISNLFVKPYGSGHAAVDSNVVTNVDTLYLRYNSYINCIAEEQNSFSFLVNKSMACKCLECGSAGLKTKIRSLEITSDSIYNGIPPNTSLNILFKANYFSGTVISIDSLKNAINNNQGKLYAVDLFSTTKPNNNKGHKLKLRIIFEDGSDVSAITGRLYWN